MLRWILVALAVAASGCTPLASSLEAGGCASNVDYLSTLPVPFAASYVGVIQQGDLYPAYNNVFPANHLYFYPFSVNPAAVPPTYSAFNVVSPGNGLHLYGVNTRHYSAYGIDEYELYMKPCNEYRVYLEHVSALSATLTAALNASNSNWLGGHSENCIGYSDAAWGNYTECSSVFTDVTLQDQDDIGTAGAYKPLAFGMYSSNAATPAYLTPTYYTQSLLLANQALGFQLNLRVWEFLNPSFPDFTHADCVLNYYPDSSSALFPVVNFTDHSGNAIATWDGSNCGTFVEDSKSGASGNWFDKATIDALLEPDGVNAPFSEWVGMALVHDKVNLNAGSVRDYPVFSFGTDIAIIGGALANLDAGRYDFVVSNVGTTNRDFDTLIPGIDYCYTVTRRDGVTAFNGAIHVKLTDSNDMLFEAFGAGGKNCGNTTIDASAVPFIR